MRARWGWLVLAFLAGAVLRPGLNLPVEAQALPPTATVQIVYQVVTATPEPTEVPTATPEPSPTPEPTLVGLAAAPVPTVMPDMGQLDLAPSAHGAGASAGPSNRGMARAILPADGVRWTDADVRLALVEASVRATCIVNHESPSLDPYALGDHGLSHGVVQLHEHGLLPLYESWSGGASPNDPYTAIAFLDWALGQGLAKHWSPVLLGMC